MLIASVFSLLLSNSLAFRRDISILYSRIGIIILFYCIYLAYNSLFITYIDNGIGIFGSLFYISSITQAFHILIFFLSLLILNMTAFYPRKLVYSEYLGVFNLLFSKLQFLKKLTISNIILKNGEQYSILEYTLVLLFVVIGSILLISSSDLISIFLAIELQSYGLYLLSTIYRNSELSTTGGLIYFLLGGLSSCFILLGTSLLYVNSGTTSMDGLYILNSISDANEGALGLTS